VDESSHTSTWANVLRRDGLNTPDQVIHGEIQFTNNVSQGALEDRREIGDITKGFLDRKLDIPNTSVDVSICNETNDKTNSAKRKKKKNIEKFGTHQRSS